MLKKYIIILFCFSITLIKLPAITRSSIVFVLCLLPFWLAMAYHLVGVKRSKDKISKNSIMLILLGFVYIYPFIIAFSFQGISVYIVGKLLEFITLILFGIIFIPVIVKYNPNLIFKLMYISLAIFILTNIGLDFVGFSKESIGSNLGNGKIAEIMNIEIQRRKLPLSSNINSFSILCSCLFVLTIVSVKLHINILIRVIILIASFYGLLISDKRAVILIAIILVILFILRFKILIFFSKRIILMLVVLPFLFIIGNGLFVIDFIKRPGEQNVDSFLRFEIWKSALSTIRFQLNTLVGYGFQGNRNAEIEKMISEIIVMDVESPTSHNFILQTIIDLGLIGTIVVLFFIKKSFYIINKFTLKNFNQYIQLAIIPLLVMMIGGVTEAVPSYYTDDVFFLFLFLLLSLHSYNEYYGSNSALLLSTTIN